MKIRKIVTALLLPALALAPGVLLSSPAGAQDKADRKADRKGQTMTLDQLPQPVQQTINDQAQGGTIGKIKHETRRGKSYYDAEITDSNGKRRHVRVDEDGTLMTRRSAGRAQANPGSMR